MARLAKEQIEPHIREMEDKSGNLFESQSHKICAIYKLNDPLHTKDVLPEIRQLLFKNGVS